MKSNLLYLLFTVIFFSSCETEVNPDLDASLEVLVIDAWLTDNDSIQHINITRSQPYFETDPPTKVPGALVTVTDLTDNVVYVFNEETERYTWKSMDGSTFGAIGHEYELNVQLDNDSYTAITTLNEVPPIDSIRFRLEEGNAFFDDLIFAEFFATDLEGINNTYWIKAWKNGRFLGKPEEINIAYDAAFSVDTDNDGVQFIQPIRDLISPIEEDDDGDILSPYNLPQNLQVEGNVIFNDDGSVYGRIENNTIFFENADVPEDFESVSLDDDQYQLQGNTLSIKGDSVYVEIHSISNEAYFFMEQVIIETDREGGFAALFATPLANVSTNISPDDPSKPVAGFFNIASVSSDGARLNREDQVRILE
ncbi:MAG: DUF4249 family protein [Bacteroidota bacterium]